MSGTAVKYTGDNADAVAALGLHIVNHPTQNVLIVFATPDALEPIGILAPGQMLWLDDEAGPRITGTADPDAANAVLPDPAGVNTDSGEAFDPSKHSVEDVQTYLKSADYTEAERVITAERDGKNRVTLVGDDDN